MPESASKEAAILLEKKAFVWIRTAYSLNGTWARVFLTESGLYVRDRIFGIKSVDIPYSSIISVERNAKGVIIYFRCGEKECWVRIRLKRGAEEMEYLLNQKISEGCTQ